jgi:hypothetical protein
MVTVLIKIDRHKIRMTKCYTDDMAGPYVGKWRGVDNKLYSPLPQRPIGAAAVMVLGIRKSISSRGKFWYRPFVLVILKNIMIFGI